MGSESHGPTAARVSEWGLCQCGCGQPTTLARDDRPEYGTVKGEPQRFVQGHHLIKPAILRFWSKVQKTDTCWNWTGTRNRQGYGQLYVEGRNRAAHRFAYEHFVGPIPEGLQIDHLCRNTACVNPDHLEVVTNAENVRRGRSAKLTAADVAAIKASNETDGALGKRYGVARNTISQVRTGKIWREVGLP